MPRKPINCEPGCHGDTVIVKNSNSDAKLLMLKEQMQQKLEQDLTSKLAIGTIKVGDTFEAGTSLEVILRGMLGGESPVPPTPTGGVKIYKGVVDELPNTVAEITALTLDESKSKATLLSSGYVWKNVSTNNQYFIIAISDEYGVDCYDIKTNGYSAACEVKEVEGYSVYHVGVKSSDTYRVEYSFEEA